MAPSAHLVFLYQFQPPFKEVINDGSHCFTFRAVIDIYANLPESHERPHADSSNYQDICSILLEQINRRLTSALLVRRIMHHGNVANFSVLDMYQRKDIAMPEVP